MNDKRLSLPANIFFNYMKLTDSLVVQGDSERVFSVRAATFWGNLQRYVGAKNMIIGSLVSAVKREIGKQNSQILNNKRISFNKNSKSKDCMEFYEQNGVFCAAEGYLNSLKDLIKEKNELINAMQKNSVAIMDLI